MEKRTFVRCAFEFAKGDFVKKYTSCIQNCKSRAGYFSLYFY